MPESALTLARDRDFELAGYVFEAARETMRNPRVVRIGSIQNKIVLPTTASVTEQVNSAASCCVSVSCYSLKI